jgi:transposase-like protein
MMAFTKEVLDEILKGYSGDPEDFAGPGGLLKQLTKALIERAMEAELTHSLGYAKGEQGDKPTSNRRNGHSRKTLRTDHGPMEVAVPRDRLSDFAPQVVTKHSREWRGFDDKILSMYALGLTTRQIQDHLKDIYAVDVSPELISRVTDEVKQYLDEWRGRPLEPVYPVVFFDALRVNIRDGGTVSKKAVYVALAVRMDGKKEVLGLWIQQNEGAKFWSGILSELKARGVKDMLIAAVDGLTGFPEAINAVFPDTEVQLCIVHMVRNSVKYVAHKEKRAITSDLKAIYSAPTAELAEVALDEFSKKWDSKYPMISKSWRARWPEVIPFLKFPPEIRTGVYTTNAIESLNYTIQKVIKHRQVFPNDESALKLIFMALKNISKKWTMPFKNWGAALNQFAIIYGDRVPL